MNISPELPLTTPPESTPTRSLRKRLLILLPVLIVMAIAAIIIGAYAFSGSESKPKTSAQNINARFEDALKPASTIKVGNYRYVSTCQLLTLPDIKQYYGTEIANETTAITEDSLSVSTASTGELSTDTVKATCGYLAKGSKSVYIRSEQLADMSVPIRVNAVIFNTSSRLDERIAALESIVGTTNNADAKEFVSTVKKWADIYKQNEKNYTVTKDTWPTFNGMVLPAYFGGDMTIFYNNAVYTIDTDKALDESSVAQLAQDNKIYKLVMKRLQQRDLSQSPAPTILGKSNAIGPTKIVEPCTVLTPAIFKAITQTDANSIRNRSTLPVDANRDLIIKNKRQPFSNNCELRNETASVDTHFNVDISYLKTEAQAKQYMIDYNDVPSDKDEKIQTNADDTIVLPPVTNQSSTTYIFRVGTYVGLIDIYTYNSDRLDNSDFRTQLSREQHIAAVNLIVDSLKTKISK